MSKEKVNNKVRLKVVWLCHFTNNNVQNIIKPRRIVGEYAPWIPLLLKILENDKDLEIHVISPHEYIRGIRTFVKNGIKYYFYNAHIPVIGRHWPGFFKWDYISNFRKNKNITKKLIDKIKPDIIHLHGAENAYYSSTALQFIAKYPVILTVQGFISKSLRERAKQKLIRIKVEEKILKNLKHCFYRTKTMAKDIKSFNPNINLYWSTYPNKEIKPYLDNKKIFDLVFFAKISKDKGIEDLLKAVSILKKSKPNLSLCVCGGGNIKPYQIMAEQLNISKNVKWAGFQPTQEDVHKLASQAKISVLPTYHDIISGTIIESLFLKIPVVAYNVGSIHEVNEKEEIISLVKKMDIEGLAKAIGFLLDNPEIQKERTEKGHKRAEELFVHSDEEIRKSLLETYTTVIKVFQKA